jgi:hypothetical protein
MNRVQFLLLAGFLELCLEVALLAQNPPTPVLTNVNAAGVQFDVGSAPYPR